MKLHFENGKLFVDNVKICRYEVPNADAIQPGSYPVEARYAHSFGKLLPFIDGVGWIGDNSGCSLVLGRVLAKSGLIPDGHLVRVLTDAIETAADVGDTVLAEVA